MKISPLNPGIIQELRAFTLFKDLDQKPLEDLCSASDVVLSDHRDMLFAANSPAEYFYIVLSGAYKLSKSSPSGEIIILHFCPPGDLMAAFIMSKESPIYPLSSTAIGPSRALRIPKKTYLKYWTQNIDLILHVQRLLTERMTTIQSQRALTKSPLSSKIASLLINLIDKQVTIQDNIQIPIPLTRKEIADSVGSSVESIIRIMSEWSKKGYISTSEQTITIANTAKIIEIMNAEQ